MNLVQNRRLELLDSELLDSELLDSEPVAPVGDPPGDEYDGNGGD
jgi:hypothetical protein